jgi:hypothetical protein
MRREIEDDGDPVDTAPVVRRSDHTHSEQLLRQHLIARGLLVPGSHDAAPRTFDALPYLSRWSH